MENWDWPQWLWVCMVGTAVAAAIVKDGQPRGNWSAREVITGASLHALILYCGGFFS